MPLSLFIKNHSHLIYHVLACMIYTLVPLSNTLFTLSINVFPCLHDGFLNALIFRQIAKIIGHYPLIYLEQRMHSASCKWPDDTAKKSNNWQESLIYENPLFWIKQTFPFQVSGLKKDWVCAGGSGEKLSINISFAATSKRIFCHDCFIILCINKIYSFWIYLFWICSVDKDLWHLIYF